jgi:MFS transporter, PPP family, 3-phenylpropionic acid transporter
VKTFSPYWRGSLYFIAFWGSLGSIVGFFGVRWIELGIQPAQLGLLAIFGPIAGFTLSPLISRMADARGNHRQIIAGSLFFMGLVLSLGVFVRDFTGALILSIATAIAASPLGSVGDGLIARMASNNNLQFGQMRLWGSLSFSITSAVFGMVYSTTGYLPMFLICGIGLMAMIPLALNLEPSKDKDIILEPTQPTLLEPDSKLPEPNKTKFESSLIVILLVNLLIGLGLGFVGPYYGVRVEQLGGNASEIGFFFGIVALSELPTMLYEKRIARKLGDAGSLLLAGIFYTFAHLAYTLAPNATWMTFSACFQGLAFGLFFVGSVRMVDARAGTLISTLQSWRNAMLGGVAPLVGAGLGGWVAGQFNVQGVFALTTAMMLVSSIVIFATRKQLSGSTTDSSPVKLST